MMETKETNHSGAMKTLLVVTAAFGGAFVGTLATHALAPAPALKASYVAAEKMQPAFEMTTEKLAVPAEKLPDFCKQFIAHYYQTFDTNRVALQSLYQDTSMLTFEGDQVMGANAILQKLTALQFQTSAHTTTSIDCQPGPANSIMVFVTGQLAVDASPNPLQFSQTFQLMPAGGSWYVHNDMFRLNYN